MTVDFMRRVDFFVGIPLCAVVSLCLKIKNFLVPEKKVARPQRVLFVELSEMGSAILVDPALRWTQAQGAEIFFIIFKRNVPSLKLLGTVPEKNIFQMRDHHFLFLALDAFRFLFWARANKIDTVVDLELFSRFTSLLTAACGAFRRVGFHAFHNEGLYRGEVLTHKVAYNPHLHISKNFMALVKSMFLDSSDSVHFKGEILDSEVRLAQASISPEAKERVYQILGKYSDNPKNTSWILLNCAGGEFLPQRRWPQEHYAKLAQMILDQNPQTKILLTGSPHERAEVEGIRVKSQRENCINFAGETKMEDLIALYDIAKVLITNDSGPAHFASTTKIPTFAFFGPETPKLYGALGNFTPLYANYACSPCVSAFNHRKTPCMDNKCLQVISPESVYKKVQACL